MLKTVFLEARKNTERGENGQETARGSENDFLSPFCQNIDMCFSFPAWPPPTFTTPSAPGPRPQPQWPPSPHNVFFISFPIPPPLACCPLPGCSPGQLFPRDSSRCVLCGVEESGSLTAEHEIETPAQAQPAPDPQIPSMRTHSGLFCAPVAPSF